MLFVFEGRTLTIPRLPSAGFKMAKSGVWGRLHINNPPNCRWGDLRVQVALLDLVRLAKNGRRSLSAHRVAEPKTGKFLQMSKLQEAHSGLRGRRQFIVSFLASRNVHRSENI